MKNPEHQTPLIERAKTAAAELYSPDLPYHNFDHALSVLEEALAIADACVEEGVPINREVLTLAALFHDAGYQLDHRAEGFESKEELASALAEKSLKELGASPQLIADVKETIIATHRDKPFNSNEQKAMRAADLSGLAKDINVFVENNRKLKAEFELLSKETITWDDWKKKTEEVVSFYLKQDIHLTSRHDNNDGKSRFHTQAQKILDQFLEMSDKELETM